MKRFFVLGLSINLLLESTFSFAMGASRFQTSSPVDLSVMRAQALVQPAEWALHPLERYRHSTVFFDAIASDFPSNEPDDVVPVEEVSTEPFEGDPLPPLRLSRSPTERKTSQLAWKAHRAYVTLTARYQPDADIPEGEINPLLDEIREKLRLAKIEINPNIKEGELYTYRRSINRLLDRIKAEEARGLIVDDALFAQAEIAAQQLLAAELQVSETYKLASASARLRILKLIHTALWDRRFILLRRRNNQFRQSLSVEQRKKIAAVLKSNELAQWGTQESYGGTVILKEKRFKGEKGQGSEYVLVHYPSLDAFIRSEGHKLETLSMEADRIAFELDILSQLDADVIRASEAEDESLVSNLSLRFRQLAEWTQKGHVGEKIAATSHLEAARAHVREKRFAQTHDSVQAVRRSLLQRLETIPRIQRAIQKRRAAHTQREKNRKEWQKAVQAILDRQPQSSQEYLPWLAELARQLAKQKDVFQRVPPGVRTAHETARAAIAFLRLDPLETSFRFAAGSLRQQARSFPDKGEYVFLRDLLSVAARTLTDDRSDVAQLINARLEKLTDKGFDPQLRNAYETALQSLRNPLVEGGLLSGRREAAYVLLQVTRDIYAKLSALKPAERRPAFTVGRVFHFVDSSWRNILIALGAPETRRSVHPGDARNWEYSLEIERADKAVRLLLGAAQAATPKATHALLGKGIVQPNPDDLLLPNVDPGTPIREALAPVLEPDVPHTGDLDEKPTIEVYGPNNELFVKDASGGPEDLEEVKPGVPNLFGVIGGAALGGSQLEGWRGALFGVVAAGLAWLRIDFLRRGDQSVIIRSRRFLSAA